MDTRAKAREEEVIYQILQRRFELLENLKMYDDYIQKKINPSIIWPSVMVSLRALFRELEPFIMSKGLYDDYKKLVDNCNSFDKAEQISTKINCFIYDLGISKIDSYNKPIKKGLADEIYNINKGGLQNGL